MKLLFIADLHYTLKQFDWLTANADAYNLVVIGGDLLDASSSLEFDVQIHCGRQGSEDRVFEIEICNRCLVRVNRSPQHLN